MGNKLVEGPATSTAVLKISGIAVLPIAGLLAGTTPCILAYKGFTTITNQGDDIRDPKKNIARSILLSLLICTVLYSLITVSMASSIGADGVVKARDYALAQAAEPLFGAWGGGITVGLGILATAFLDLSP